MRVVTVNGGRGAGPANPNNEIWVNNPDLTKRRRDRGFADLMPGSGHGTGGVHPPRHDRGVSRQGRPARDDDRVEPVAGW